MSTEDETESMTLPTDEAEDWTVPRSVTMVWDVVFLMLDMMVAP
tara:strand:- start:87 stop:218 length:132 start_codon:yes stop_codon:yes gene_type:complete